MPDKPLAALASSVLCLLVAGCATPPSGPPPPAVENDVVVHGDAVVVPDQRWRLRQHQGNTYWTFKNRASLIAWISGPRPEEALMVRLLAGPKTLEHRFRFYWDDEELPEAQVEAERSGWRLTLRPEQLERGSHELYMRRNHKKEAKEARGDLVSVFGRVVFRYGGTRQALEAERLAKYQQLALFLQFGVFGEGREKRGGILFVGSGSHRLSLAEAGAEAVDSGGGQLVVEPHNVSGAPAVFRLGDKRLTLEPGGTGRLSVAAQPELELEVEGADAGYFFWGLPRIERAGVARSLPPIVLITLDTTRRDALGPYNGRTDLTPNLDRLARHATVFEQAYSTAPWTLPSHASMMTGLYPSKHGAGVTRKHLDEMPTLASLLRRRGYFAAGWSSGDLSSSRFGLAQGFHLYRDPEKFETPGGLLAENLDRFLDGYHHLPLFLFINYFDAHALYEAPQPWQEKLGVPALREPLSGKPEWQGIFDSQMKSWSRFVHKEVEVSPQGLDYLRAAYLAEVAYLDHLLGRLFDRLRALGLYDRALIVVTADHGENLGERGYLSHVARLDPELVEIPLLIKWPGQKEGRRSRRLVSLIDLFPTILRAAGIEPPASDGLSLPATAGNGGPTHRFVLLEEHESIVHPLPDVLKISRNLFGVQRPGFRQLVWEGAQSCARRNGSAWHDEECSSDGAAVLEAIRAQLGVGEGEAVDPSVLEEVRESLEALGYL